MTAKSEGLRILLADSQPLTAAGIVQILSERDDVEIIGEVKNKEAFSDEVNLHNPSLVIADYNIPGFITIEDIRQLKTAKPDMNVLVISSDNNKRNILEILQLGVKGYLTKECSKEEVLMAIQATARGEKFFCHKILDIIMEKSFSPEPDACDPTVLTVRETEVLKLIASGYSTQRVAEELFLSPHTVHTLRERVIMMNFTNSCNEFVIVA